MTRKVFIVSNGGHDYADATSFGELIFCTDGVIKKHDIAQMYRELSQSLDCAEPDDYLMISSLTSLCVVAASILANRFGELHLLVYHDGAYVVKDLILENPGLEG